MLQFDENNYTDEELTLEGITIRFRAFRHLMYVENPKDAEHQQMNIFVPLDYYEGKSINGYTAETAPTFMPNLVGGYMPGEQNNPGYEVWGPKKINSAFYALAHGYVVATPALRGRSLKDAEGNNVGKAPAVITDYKAAVRYVRYFSDKIPGDQEKIITNGTSAGGAISSVMGATGNHPDYEPYLKEAGAADARDDIFAASCYCPITNLDHADSAYEWEFCGVNDYYRFSMSMDEGGRPSFTPEDGVMNDVQIKASGEEAKLFTDYLNSLELKDEAGNPLTLDADGNGSFKDYMMGVVLASAQRAMDSGVDVSDKTWLTTENGKAVAMDFDAYVRDITRMKTAPAFDDLTMDSPENDLFGTETEACRHFTAYSYENSLVGGKRADEQVVKLMNPMYYIDDDQAAKAPHWRIRHGECDRDSSLAISAMLTLKLRGAGYPVDYHSPWDTPHSGDYDLDELFAWIDEICK